MKSLLKYIFPIILIAGCSREKFAEYNTNPDAVLSIDPVTEFPSAALALHTNDFEAFYDYNRNINLWTLLWVQPGGNAATFRQNIVSTGSYTYRYDDLYSRNSGGVGGNMNDIKHLISIMPDDKKATYANINAIAGVPLAYAAFYLSDILGSIAYSNAFQARYTNPANLTPKYDAQADLYDTLNNQLKNIVNTLSATPSVTQVLLGSSDLYFHGQGNEATNWAKAANSLRLKMAMRMLKRNPSGATAIITDVLSSSTGVIDSRADQWVFEGGAGQGGGGNWNPGTPSGEKNLVDFMYSTSDPRVRNLYQITAVSQDMFDSAQAQGVIPASEHWQPYVGRYASPDAAKITNNLPYVTNITFSYKGVSTNIAYPSQIQNSMWDPSYLSKNSNRNFPVITYADVCFMRAELATTGITSENAQDWYYKGIEASLADYDQWGNDAQVVGYTALSPAEISAYEAQPGIKYDPANALEQICVQEFINFHSNSNEMWALIKRTGYPSTTGNIFKEESITANGTVQPIPRRWTLTLPLAGTLNYTNQLQAITDMQKDPDLGDLSDITGRVWWDMK